MTGSDEGEIAIRLAGLDDLGTVTEITDAAYRHYIPLLGAPPLPMTEDYAPRIERGEIWLLEKRSVPAGLLVIERHDTYSEIFNVAVAPDQHGGGLGRRLLDFAVHLTRGWGLPELRLYTNAKMERNIEIYRRYGFSETGRRPNPRRPEFTIVDMAMRV